MIINYITTIITNPKVILNVNDFQNEEFSVLCIVQVGFYMLWLGLQDHPLFPFLHWDEGLYSSLCTAAQS